MSLDLSQNPKWVQRTLNFFDFADKNNNGYLEIDEVIGWANVLKKYCRPTEEEFNNFRDRMREFYTALGVTSSGTYREDWPRAVSRFADAERERKRNGQRTMYQEMSDALFDILDRDKNGVVTLDELEIRMMAYGMPKESAKEFMKLADTKKKGVLGRQELYDVDFNFWFGDMDPELDALYGDVYRGDDMTHIDLTKNSKWVKRTLSFFDYADFNQNGVLELDEVVAAADILRDLCHPSDAELDQYKMRLREFYSCLGMTSAGVRRADWPTAVNRFATSERERKRKGEKTQYQMVSDALFDIIDTDKNGVVTIDELKIRNKAFCFPEEAAKTIMDYADTNKNGVLEREELYEIDFKFWFCDIDPRLDLLYGDWFSGVSKKTVDLTKNPKWVRRTLNYFDLVDTNKNGVLELEEIVNLADGLLEHCNPTYDEIENFKKLCREFYAGLGVTSTGVRREDWPASVSKFAASEWERKNRGQVTQYQRLSDALFDIIDQDKNGVVTIDELRIRNRAFGFPEDSAQPFLDLADTNRNGVLEREELYEIDFNFWFGTDVDDKLDALYGECYRGQRYQEKDLTKNGMWVKRVLAFFDYADVAKTGLLKLDDVVNGSVETVKNLCHPSKAELKRYKNLLREFYSALGMTSEGTRREDWPAAVNKFAAQERARKNNGEKSIVDETSDALFDILDTDKNNVITMNELKIRMKAYGMPEEAAVPFMALADTNKNGVLERKEMYDIDFRFWFGDVDADLDDLYGDWFKGGDKEDRTLLNNEKWVNRVLSFFDYADRNGNGVLEIEEVMGLTDKLSSIIQVVPKEVEEYKKRLREFYSAMGLTSFGIRRSDWPAAVNRFAAAERARSARGDMTMYRMVSDALFDIIDQDKNGVVSMQELIIRMKAFGFPEESAIPFMHFADTNRNGVLEREEMYEADFNFWFGMVSDDVDNLYGDHFRGYSYCEEDLTKNPVRVKRILNYFDFNDKAKRGVITLGDIMEQADKLEKLCKPRPEELQRLKDRMIEFYSAMGYTSGGLKREDAPAAINRFAQAERERKKKGQVTLYQTLSDALFDILDQDKNNVITMNELKVRMQAFGMPVEAARPFMEFADTNKNGVLERSEMYEVDFNFWFGNVDSKYDSLYGGIF